MSKLVEAMINLNERQRERINNASPNQTIMIKLKKDCLEGFDIVLVSEITRLMIQDRKNKRGLMIKIFPKNDIEERNGELYLMY